MDVIVIILFGVIIIQFICIIKLANQRELLRNALAEDAKIFLELNKKNKI